MASSTPWPAAGDYSAAIQNAHNCFADQELASGRAQTNRLGLPIGASGTFAVVYELQSSARVFAVRCFIRPVTNQQQRYDALSHHLRGFWLPTLVDYAYLPQGIRIRGQWYPIVRMEWVAGKQLHQYVEDHIRQGQIIERLAAQWRGVVAGLRGAHTAHGDLQHGNILVDNHSQIRLVDYDGFFIPALHANPPGEVGHPSYQHPERIRHGYYAENADAFSALVIYLSLLALRTDPSLWTFHTGENLLFKADDFAQPGRTPLWSRFQASGDAEVRRLTAALEASCREPVTAVPDLETVIQRLPGRAPFAVMSGVSTRPPLVSPIPTPPSQAAPTPPQPIPVHGALMVRLIRLCAAAWWGFVTFLGSSARWGLIVTFLLVAIVLWWLTQPSSLLQAPPQGGLRDQVGALWHAGACTQAESALQEARRQQPNSAEPYLVAIQLLLQGGPCQEALGVREPVPLLADAIRGGMAEALPVRVEVETAYGTVLRVAPKDIRRLERSRVELRDGSRYQGTIRIKEG